MQRASINHKYALAFIAVVAVAVATAGAATELTVPGDFPTIQEAIDAAESGATIVVAPGTYNEAVNFNGKSIHLRSKYGPHYTTIDASGLNASAVTIANGEGLGTILNGFTITGGTGTPASVQVFPAPAPPVEGTAGGGIFLHGTVALTIDSCIIKGNEATVGGGMFARQGAQPTVTHVLFKQNTGTYGGAIHSRDGSTPSIHHSVIREHSASIGPAMHVQTNGTPIIFNTFICDNLFSNPISGSWNNLGNTIISNECVIQVPQQMASIQEAIDIGWVWGPDAIEVAPGTYHETIRFNGVPVHLRSTDGPEVTILDGAEKGAASGDESVVVFLDDEGPDSILEGFTIRKGGGTLTPFGFKEGGGIYIEFAAPTIKNCIVWGNGADLGGGVATWMAAPTFIDCEFTENGANIVGGGMFAGFGSDILIQNSWIHYNEIWLETAGGGIYVEELPGIETVVALESSMVCNNYHDQVFGTWYDLGGNLVNASCEPEPKCPGDLTGDCVVGVADLLILLASWGPCADCAPGNCPADLTGDCSVGVADLLELLANWG